MKFRKAEFKDFIQQHAALFDQQENPFTHSDWLLHFTDQIIQDDWTIHVPYSNSDGQSLMLLYSTPDKPRQIRPFMNWYTCLYSPFVTSAQDKSAALKAVTRRIKFDTVQLEPITQEDAKFIRRAFPVTRTYFQSANHYLPCQGVAFDDYMDLRPSALFNTWKRKSKKFTGSLEIFTDTDIERGIQAYQTVYAKSWKQPEPTPDFVPGFIRMCAAKGWLRLGVAWLGETPIAVQFWYVFNGTAYIYKLAYDEQHKPLSAGTILTAHMFRHAMDVDKVSEIDYLSGNDAYKRDWMTHRRDRVGLIISNPTTLTGAISAARNLVGSARQIVHQCFSRSAA